MFFMLTAKVYAWLCQMGIWRSITRSNASVLITTKVICNIVSLKRQRDKDCGGIVDYKQDEGLKSVSQEGVEKRRRQTASGVQSLAYCIRAYALGAGQCMAVGGIHAAAKSGNNGSCTLQRRRLLHCTPNFSGIFKIEMQPFCQVGWFLLIKLHVSWKANIKTSSFVKDV